MILEPNPVTALQPLEFTINVVGNAIATQAGLAFRRHAQQCVVVRSLLVAEPATRNCSHVPVQRVIWGQRNRICKGFFRLDVPPGPE